MCTRFSRQPSSITAILAAAMAAGLLACGSGAAPDDDDGAGNRSGHARGENGGSEPSDAGGTFYCCINGAFYGCPGETEVKQCGGFDVDGCMAACGFDDFLCQDNCFEQWSSSSPDPSGCTRNESEDSACSGPDAGAGGSSGGGGSDGGSGSDCSDILSACDYNFECCSGNCTNGGCWGNSSGDPCEYNFHCSSGTCSGGTCE